MSAWRRRLWVERFFWGRWVPLYVRLLAKDTPFWTTCRLHGPVAGAYWLMIVVRTLYVRHRQFTREACA